ncbi:MAG: carboxypeptidase-like regulatory domain-containing protein, partial [Verrucomicrobia bacterium]|nr:carboxypeptidase-like regulatory domain-containing protein [Verrucomicrobiota bacterium]
MACRYQYISTTTAVNGAFDLGVVAGTWSIMLENDSANQANLVGPSLSYTVIDGQTIPAIAYQVRSGTATISGTVKDSANNPVSAANVYAYATINSVQYNAGAQTDGNGTYSFPVINGTWHVGVNANDYPNLTNNASYGGVTSSTLLVTGATSGQNGYRYRA